MGYSKILLAYKGEGNHYRIESLWATKEGSYYRINNIPFYATNVALNDLISVEADDGALYFKNVVETSGHSVIQMIIFNDTDLGRITRQLEKLGCKWEGSNHNNLISIDIPKEVNYNILRAYLDKGENENIWSYKEACLSHEL